MSSKSKIVWPQRRVVVDTREQLAWPWPTDRVLRSTLNYADYSLEGLEDVVRVERKSLQDLVGSLTTRKPDDAGSNARSPRQRLKDELCWMGENVTHPYLIVEGSWADLANHNYRSGMHPSSVIGAVLGWTMRYGIHIFMAETREQAFGLANRIFVWAERIEEERTNDESTGSVDVGTEHRDCAERVEH